MNLVIIVKHVNRKNYQSIMIRHKSQFCPSNWDHHSPRKKHNTNMSQLCLNHNFHRPLWFGWLLQGSWVSLHHQRLIINVMPNNSFDVNAIRNLFNLKLAISYLLFSMRFWHSITRCCVFWPANGCFGHRLLEYLFSVFFDVFIFFLTKLRKKDTKMFKKVYQKGSLPAFRCYP